MNKYAASDLTEEVSDKAIKVATKADKIMRKADETVRKFPYRAIGIALGLGTLIGFFSTRHSFTKNE